MPPKIVIIGNEGAGKSTLAAALAASLGVPHIEVESVTSLQRALVDAKSGWVVEGMRRGTLRDQALPAADTLVWLDVSRMVILSSLLGNAVTGRLRSSRVDGMRSQRDMRRELRALSRAMRRHRGRRKRYEAMVEKAQSEGITIVKARTRRAARRALKSLPLNAT